DETSPSQTTYTSLELRQPREHVSFVPQNSCYLCTFKPSNLLRDHLRSVLAACQVRAPMVYRETRRHGCNSAQNVEERSIRWNLKIEIYEAMYEDSSHSYHRRDRDRCVGVSVPMLDLPEGADVGHT